jgi:hypothetical protein
MWTIERQHEFHGRPEALDIQERMHNDLLALQGLTNELPRIIGARVVVEKGYAIDAACNGRLTRTHYDTDLVLATPYVDEPERLYGVIREVLDRSTGFAWRSTQQIRPSWVKFHESGKREWDDGITGTEQDNELAHQMDLHFVYAADPFASDKYIDLSPRAGITYRKPIMGASLYDSYGQRFDLTVPTVSDMAATKLRLNRSFDTFYGHEMRESDFYDFGQLFESRCFDPEEFYAMLADYYRNKGSAESTVTSHILSELQPLAHLVPQNLVEYLAAQDASTDGR